MLYEQIDIFEIKEEETRKIARWVDIYFLRSWKSTGCF